MILARRELVEDQSVALRKVLLNADAWLKWLEEYIALAKAKILDLGLL